MSETSAVASGPVTIVTQTRVQTGREGDFTRWQDDIGRQIAAFPGFVKQTVMPPNPPSQVDWVILQAFASLEVESPHRPPPPLPDRFTEIMGPGAHAHEVLKRLEKELFWDRIALPRPAYEFGIWDGLASRYFAGTAPRR